MQTAALIAALVALVLAWTHIRWLHRVVVSFAALTKDQSQAYSDLFTWHAESIGRWRDVWNAKADLKEAR